MSNKEELELYHGNFMFSLFLKLKGQWPKNQKKDLSAPLSPTLPPSCVNCDGNHAAFDRYCPKWATEYEIQQLKVT